VTNRKKLKLGLQDGVISVFRTEEAVQQGQPGVKVAQPLFAAAKV
jgi:hypothetical protein